MGDRNPQPVFGVSEVEWLLDAAGESLLVLVELETRGILGASRAVGRLLGRPAAMFAGDHVSAIVQSPDMALLAERARSGPGSTDRTDVTLRHASGEPVAGVARCALVRGRDDATAMLIILHAVDTDGRDELDRYFDAGLDLHCIADTDGYFRRLSAEWERVLGYPREELLGSRFLDYVHPDDIDATLEAMSILQQQDVVLNFENRYRCADGSYRWLEWRSLPMGKTVYAAARDITDRKLMERELVSSREEIRLAGQLLESVLDAIPDVIGIQDRNHRVLRYNRAGYEFLGLTEAQVAGRRCFELIGRSRPCEDCATTDALVTKRPSRVERYYDEGGVWLDCRSYPVASESGRVDYVVEHLRDVSDLKRAEEKLRATEQRLAQGQRMEAIGQLAGGIAHDFNNQLAGVVGNADLLRLSLADRPDLQALAENVLVASRRAQELTAQLLAFARKGKYQSVDVDLHRIVGEVVSILEHSIDKRIRIQQQLNASHAITYGDPNQIQNAVLNLALNARDAMPEGGNLLFRTRIVDVTASSGEVGVFDVAPGQYVTVSVSDTGVGIPADIQRRIFEPFFTTKPEGKGTGMGLAAVYGTMQRHEGSVRLTSFPGEGSCFELFFRASSRESTVDELRPAKLRCVRGRHVLVVDDDRMVRDVATRMLTHLGHRVSVCQNGREAIDFYRTSWPAIDLVVLDMVMPDVDGSDTYRELRGINPNVVVLVSSGYAIDEKIQALLDQGAAGFVQKPFTMHLLNEKVAAALYPNQNEGEDV